MSTEDMIRELRNVAEKHKNDRLGTFDLNLYLMCTEVAQRLEELSTKKTCEGCANEKEREMLGKLPKSQVITSPCIKCSRLCRDNYKSDWSKV